MRTRHAALAVAVLALTLSACTIQFAAPAPPTPLPAPSTVTVPRQAPASSGGGTTRSGGGDESEAAYPTAGPELTCSGMGAHAPSCDGPGSQEFTRKWIRFYSACYQRQVSEATCDAFDAATAQRIGWTGMPVSSYGGGQTSTSSYPTSSEESSSYSISASGMSWLSSNWPTLYSALASGDSAGVSEAISNSGPDPAYQQEIISRFRAQFPSDAAEVGL